MKNMTLEDKNWALSNDLYSAQDLKDYLNNVNILRGDNGFFCSDYVVIRDVRLEKNDWRSCFAIQDDEKIKMNLDLELIGYFDLYGEGQKEIIFYYYQKRIPQIFEINEKTNTIKDYFWNKISNYPKVLWPNFS
jgi:hypothetical protein